MPTPDILPLASRPARRARVVVRALRAPNRRKWLWLRSLGLVAAARLGLWTLPLRTLQVLAARLGRGRYSAPIVMQGLASQPADLAAEAPVPEPEVARLERELNWAVTRAARVVPEASCLTQALSLQVLLARRGLGSRLCIGVRKGDKGFEAHAWVERGGRILIGGENNTSQRGAWTPLTAWDFSVEPDSSLDSGGASL